MVVGTYPLADGIGAFSDEWNGTSWSITDSNVGPLVAVACAARDSCVAVGAQKKVSLAATWNGTVWTKTTTPDPAVMSSFKPTSGPPGTKVKVLGVSLRNAGSVVFDGVPAKAITDDPSEIVVKMPTDATTGPIGVATTAGSTASATNFTGS
jgi:hypothetical protein